MDLIEVKCRNCNASLQVNSSLSNVQCNYCGEMFYIDDEASQIDRKLHAYTNAKKRLDDADIEKKERYFKMYMDFQEYQKQQLIFMLPIVGVVLLIILIMFFIVSLLV